MQVVAGAVQAPARIVLELKPHHELAAAQAPAFDAASIKPSPPPQVGFSPVVRIGPQPGGRWIATMSTVFDLLRSLYPQNYFNGHDFGGPDRARRPRKPRRPR